MQPDQVHQIAAWLAATDIGLLELRGPALELRLRNDGGQVQAAPDAPPVTASAGSVGVFLHRHPLHETPLAPIGETVRAGQPLGLLQIGALLLPVPAPQDGVVTALPVAHSTLVGYGTPLVELQPGSSWTST